MAMLPCHDLYIGWDEVKYPEPIDKETKTNPYVDNSLLESLTKFSPHKNEQLLSTHHVKDNAVTPNSESAVNAQLQTPEKCTNPLSSDSGESLPNIVAQYGYVLKEKICKTSQGSVWKATKLKESPPLQLIIKISSKELVDSGTGILTSGVIVQLKEDIIAEAALLQELGKCPRLKSVVKYYGFIRDPKYYILIMSDGGTSLQQFVEKAHEFIIAEKLFVDLWIPLVQRIFKQLIDGMLVLYNELKIAHLDISMENILIEGVEFEKQYGDRVSLRISDDFAVTLCDFGLAQKFGKLEGFKCDKFSGKRRYCSPQVFVKKRAFDAKANDIWSIGICLFVALIGWNPYTTPTERDYQYGLIIKGKLEQLLAMMDKEHLVNDQAVDLLERILKEKEEDRISLKQIEKHPFLRMY